MARKHVTKPHKLLDAVDLSTSQTSAITNVEQLDKAAIHLSWTSGASPVGDITIEARNGEDDVWHTLDFGATISISGASGSHQLLLKELPFKELRVVYTRTSGSATLDAIITMKTVGA